MHDRRNSCMSNVLKNLSGAKQQFRHCKVIH
jgi:hypothetical protein